MTSLFLSQNGYSSCIKIAGIPILPPLMSDERRNQLQEEKAKAIEIEKRIKRKRTSIDSGVMTGSYIDNFKNSETLLAENSTYQELSISDLNLNLNPLQTDKLLAEDDSRDSFLKSALQDSEFREFFYSTAERIFKDKNILNDNTSSEYDSSTLLENHNSDKLDYSKQNTNKEIVNGSQMISQSEPQTQPSNFLNLNINDHEALTSFTDKINEVKMSQVDISVNKPFTEAIHQTSPEKQRVRRNSYTLDSPSPILLEHMAKGNAHTGKNSEVWQVISDTKGKGLGFKTFLDTKKQRKTWNKNSTIRSPPKVEMFPDSKVPNGLTKKSKTFVQTDKSYDNSNYSLPSSSCSSPTHFSTFAHSSDCIQSVYNNSLNCINTNSFELSKNDTSCKQEKGLKVLHQLEIPHTNENESTTTDQSSGTTIKDLAKDLSNTLPINNTSITSCANYETLLLFPSSQDLPKDSTNRKILVDQSSSETITESRTSGNKRAPSNDMDDTVSVCSSLSLSKFMPFDDTSRPSTAEDLSALFSELQLRHERQIAELLEMQHKEKLILSRLHSNCGSVSGHSTTNLSISEFSVDLNNSLPGTGPIEKIPLCSRELFPMEDINLSPPKEETHVSNQHYNSEKEKIAALKLTAYVRGYLTRRLLKTERVQQLIDTIKESLNCAFSLQSETELRKNDLELHERLAHQLSAALYELQTIISAPVATRMAIIATDREKLRKPVSRPSSAISSATQKSILRRQKSLNNTEKKSQETNNNKAYEVRPRTKSLCLLGTSSLGASGRSDSSSTCSSSSHRKPWR